MGDVLGVILTVVLVFVFFMAGVVWIYRTPKRRGRGTGAFGLVKVEARPDGSIVSIELNSRSLEEGPHKLSIELLLAIKSAQEEAKAKNPPDPDSSPA